jgi:hypothetical protein
MMDKDTFFASLTNEAATPDPEFIEALRKKVVAIAGGGSTPGAGSGSLFSGPTIIVAGIITSLIAGGITFGVMSNNPSDLKPDTVSLSSAPDQNDDTPAVLGDETSADDTSQNEDAQKDENTDDAQPAAPATPSDSPTDTPNDTPTDNTPQDDSVIDPGDAVPSGLFTIDFWNLPSFKTPPLMHTGPADLTLTNVAAIDFDWAGESPDATINSDYFTARVTATQHFEPGNYKINMTIDDGVRVYIDGNLIYERWTQNAGVVDEAFFNVKDAGSVEIVYEYYEQTLNAIFKAEISEHIKTTSPRGEAVLIRLNSAPDLP